MIGTSRLVARRASGHLGVLLTACLTALVAAVLLVSATVMAPGVAENALERTLAAADGNDSALTVSTGLDDHVDDLDAGVHAAADSQPGVVASISSWISSTAFTATGLAADDRLAITSIDRIADHAELSEGRWPAAAASTSPAPEAAIHAAALDRLGVAVGDTVTVEPLTGAGAPVTITVVGTYLPTDADDPIWDGHGDGVQPAESDDLTIVGPVVVERAALLTQIQPGTASVSWRLPLDTSAVTIGNADDVSAGLAELTTEIRDLRAGQQGRQMSIISGARELIGSAQDAASSARALLLVIVAMLTVLGIWALAFTARLVAVRRAPATALLRARGADDASLLRWSLAGNLLPALAVAAAAPPLAELALRPLRVSGALAEGDGMSALAPAGWVVAAALAVLWLILMVSADVSAGRSISGVALASSRPRRAAVQRAGLDLVLLALALVALQQLRRPPETASELVLVVAPAVIVLAGTVVLIRALPWVAGVVARAARARPGAAAMLGATETARRSARHVAAAILVVLAITVSVFAATTQRTWTTFSAATVDVTEPADVRVEASFAAPDAMHGFENGLADLPGIDASMRVFRDELTIEDLELTVLAFDIAAAPDIVRMDAATARALRGLADDAGDGVLPALITRDAAESLGLGVGDETALDLRNSPIRYRVAGLVDAVPGVPEATAILVDGPSLANQLGDKTDDVLDDAIADEWWLAAGDDSTAGTLAAAAAELPGTTGVTTHAAARTASVDDPAAAGLVTGLTAGLAFAAAFVLIGVVVHTVTTLQARSSEFAVMRAIGLGRRGLTSAVSVEQAVLLGFSTVTGLGLGVLVAWLVVPHTVGGLTGLPEVPPLRLDVPWELIAVLGAGIVVLALVLVAVQGRLTRRIDVAAVLRAGEDT